MKAFPVILFVTFAFSLHSTTGSSVRIPVNEHLKYSFGNHKNHPVQKQEEQRYLRSLATMNETDIRAQLHSMGYEVHSLTLRDIATELLYQANVSNKTKEKFTVYLDPKNGTILKTERSQ